MHAYNELYLDAARTALGEALDYAVYRCSVSAEDFMTRFIATPWARRFETGVPGTVAGKSGTELAMAVIRDTGGLPTGGDYPVPSDTVKPSEEFWAGWVLAYSQWRDNLRFRDLLSVVPVNKVIAMYYPYHEASEDKFADFVADQLKARPFASALAHLRKTAGLSQSDLARMTGMNIRNIQQYEQGVNDIRKAGFDKVEALASVLGCSVTALTSAPVSV